MYWVEAHLTNPLLLFVRPPYIAATCGCRCKQLWDVQSGEDESRCGTSFAAAQRAMRHLNESNALSGMICAEITLFQRETQQIVEGPKKNLWGRDPRIIAAACFALKYPWCGAISPYAGAVSHRHRGGCLQGGQSNTMYWFWPFFRSCERWRWSYSGKRAVSVPPQPDLAAVSADRFVRFLRPLSCHDHHVPTLCPQDCMRWFVTLAPPAPGTYFFR